MPVAVVVEPARQGAMIPKKGQMCPAMHVAQLEGMRTPGLLHVLVGLHVKYFPDGHSAGALVPPAHVQPPSWQSGPIVGHVTPAAEVLSAGQ